jgi:hypothetical protein
MRIRLPKRRVWRVLIYIVSFALILLAIDLILVQAGRRITVGYETTRITEPTISPGQGGPIDYLAALENHYQQGVTNQNNMMPLLLEAVGPRGLPENQPGEAFTDRLGMPPLPEHGDYFQGLEKFLGNSNEPDDLASLIERPWKTSERPRTAAWLKANKKPLAKMIEASKRTRFYFPLHGEARPETLMECSLPYLLPARQIGRALIVRATLKVGESNDFAGAREDLDAAHRLAALLTQGATLIDRLVGYSIDSEASRAEQSLAADGKLSGADLREWASAIEKLPPINSYGDGIDISERYLYLDLMQHGARRGLGKFQDAVSQSPPPKSRSFLWNLAPVRWGHAMAVGNHWYDRLAAAAAKSDRVERRSAILAVMRDIDTDIRNKPASTIMSSDWPIAMFAPALERIGDKEDATVANRVLAQLAAALAAYQAERGGYPETLDALAPAYLAAVPSDPFTNKPLVYRPTKAGYLLYSVGPDLSDDGGKAMAENKGDLAVRAGDAAIATTTSTRP